MRRIISVGLIGLISACAVSKVDPLVVPLAYTSSAKPLVAKSPACSALSRIEVEDRRSEKVLGIRYHESKPLKADVTAGSDPAVWVHEGMQAFLARNGIAAAPNAPRLVVELRVLRTQENIWHRSGYEAHISLAARLESRSGKSCGEQSVEGKGGNYGYSGSVENYQETLSSALDDAAQHLLDSPLFDSALCQCPK